VFLFPLYQYSGVLAVSVIAVDSWLTRRSKALSDLRDQATCDGVEGLGSEPREEGEGVIGRNFKQ